MKKLLTLSAFLLLAFVAQQASAQVTVYNSSLATGTISIPSLSVSSAAIPPSMGVIATCNSAPTDNIEITICGSLYVLNVVTNSLMVSGCGATTNISVAYNVCNGQVTILFN
jgi:hypothetical protein